MLRSAPERPVADSDPRMAGLSAESIARMHAAAGAIRDGANVVAERLLGEVLAMAPEHPEALRLYGILYSNLRRPADALAVLRRAHAVRPNDALILSDLGNAQRTTGDLEGAIASWRRACELAPEQAIPWFNLGRTLQLQGASAKAAEALQRACTLAPDILPAQILLGDALVHLGRFDEAATRYRDVLLRHPACGDAWRGLSNIKTRALSPDDGQRIATLLRQGGINDDDRIAMGHALGKLEEDDERHPQAFSAFNAANALMRTRSRWSVQAFRNYVDAALEATTSLPSPIDPDLGREVIFLVGLPRSGSTVFEQILAAHPDVEGASELPDLGILIQEESQRRKQPYPQWIPHASAADWQRLGNDYLRRTARWRTRHPRSTDKMPENWKHAGILRAMLPGATVIDVRRDPLETGWSCFKQQFYQLPHFSNDLADIAAYLRGCEQAMDIWRARAGDRIHLYHYKDLLADPEAMIRRLLQTCGLTFDARCLEFHAARRSVRTASAAQVRQPLRRDTARARHYGALLDPLRNGLAKECAQTEVGAAAQ